MDTIFPNKIINHKDAYAEYKGLDRFRSSMDAEVFYDVIVFKNVCKCFDFEVVNLNDNSLLGKFNKILHNSKRLGEINIINANEIFIALKYQNCSEIKVFKNKHESEINVYKLYRNINDNVVFANDCHGVLSDNYVCHAISFSLPEVTSSFTLIKKRDCCLTSHDNLMFYDVCKNSVEFKMFGHSDAVINVSNMHKHPYGFDGDMFYGWNTEKQDTEYYMFDDDGNPVEVIDIDGETLLRGFKFNYNRVVICTSYGNILMDCKEKYFIDKLPDGKVVGVHGNYIFINDTDKNKLFRYDCIINKTIELSLLNECVKSIKCYSNYNCRIVINYNSESHIFDI